MHRQGTVNAILLALALACDTGARAPASPVADLGARSVAVGNMSYKRSAFTLTRLADGRVLAVGGYGSTGVGVPQALASAEVFNPATGTWTLTGSMLHARMHHTATLLHDGRVLVAGGSDGGSYLDDSVTLYDPTTGQWSTVARLPSPRMIHTATLLEDGRVLIAGGLTGALASASTVTDDCRLYDPVANTWSYTGRLTTPRRMHTAVRIADGRIVAAYGWGGSGEWPTGADIYDPSTGSWSAAPSPTAWGGRARQTAFALPDGRALFAGGESKGGIVDGSSLLFDPVARAWTKVGWLTPRSDAAGVVLDDGRALLLGGGTGGTGPQSIAEVDAFDPRTSTWTSLPPLLSARTEHQAVLLQDGRVLVAGGTGLHSSEIYGKATATVTLVGLSQTYDGTPRSASATTKPAGLSVTFSYGGSPTPPTDAGSYAVVATVDDPNYQGTASGTLVIGKATATVSLVDLTHAYDGTPRSASATTDPAGLSVTLSYDGSPTPPTDAGSYAVVATVDDANYQGTASGTLVIGKATATVSLVDLTHTYDGTPRSASATTDPAGLSVTLSYDGSPTPPIDAGTYDVVATVEGANHRGSASGTLVIGKATATVSLVDLTHTYDGTPRSASATTEPAGLSVTFTYGRSPTPPTDAGSYAVLATVDDANYQGSASGTLVVEPAARGAVHGGCGSGGDESTGAGPWVLVSVLLAVRAHRRRAPVTRAG